MGVRGGENCDYSVGEKMTKQMEETIPPLLFFQLSLFELDAFLPHRESVFFMLTEAQQD